VMLTTREVGEDGFGKKNRDWNRADLLEKWRERWAEHVNTRMAELDIDARVDHRSLEAQGIDLEPQHKIGPAASRMAAEGLESERLAEHAEIARSNGEKLLANPGLALDAITHGQATFTTRDLAMFVHRHSDGKEQFDQVMAAVKAAPELVALGNDGRGEQRFTSRAMIETEQRLAQATDAMVARDRHAVPEHQRDAALARSQARGMDAAAGRIDAMVARSRSVVEQDRELLRNRIGFAVAGIALCAILPGAVARSLPVSWAAPERIAARMLGTDMWSAGEDMMEKADRKRWTQIVARQQEREPDSSSRK